MWSVARRRVCSHEEIAHLACASAKKKMPALIAAGEEHRTDTPAEVDFAHWPPISK
jgi:hypothetical protein